MIKSDFGLFSTEETRELDETFDSEGIPIRRRYIVYGAVVAVAFAIGIFAWGASREFILATFIAYVLLSAFEKMTYLKSQDLTRGVMQKLVHRIEALEGVPTTPENARPRRTSETAV